VRRAYVGLCKLHFRHLLRFACSYP
jgi:hypothetical protein